ncbi:hypothetical protein A0256_20715 [Mucilaginibacter sp. PAMC 26640]|nr:hypothetical protein A0256_20715 [Mucilaginibacter sp. PAMC 26640]
MKNLNYINCTEINEFDLIVNSKHEPTKTRLVNLRQRINIDFNDYLTNFNNVVNLPTSTYVTPDSDALKGCYDIKTKARDDLMKRIYNAQSVDFQTTCAYCLYFLTSTIDHYIPIEEYSEFGVLAKNLFPCCSNCNAIKNRFWRQDNNRLFIHLYNDIIPNVRFLFCNLQFSGVNPVITFSINNNGALINTDLFSVMNSHFTKLNLCQLYSYGIPKLVSDIKTDIKAVKRILTGTINPMYIKLFY